MGTYRHNNQGKIGDNNLKRFNRGSLATNTPLTKLDHKIYMLFMKDIPMKRIQLALKNDHVTMNEQQLFDVVRKVGFETQSFYRKLITTPFNKDQIIFSEFVKGTGLQQLCEDYGLDPPSLIKLLRKVGLLYLTYQIQYQDKKI